MLVIDTLIKADFNDSGVQEEIDSMNLSPEKYQNLGSKVTHQLFYLNLKTQTVKGSFDKITYYDKDGNEISSIQIPQEKQQYEEASPGSIQGLIFITVMKHCLKI